MKCAVNRDVKPSAFYSLKKQTFPAALPGAVIFALYSPHTPIVIREGIFAVRESLKALSQIATVPSGTPLFLYEIDKQRLCHAGWTADGHAFYNAQDMGFEGDLYPFRLRVKRSLCTVMTVPIRTLEQEIHAQHYSLGLDRSCFKATACYWIGEHQLHHLLAHPAWQNHENYSKALLSLKAHHRMATFPLVTPKFSGHRCPLEQRLTLKLQKHFRELSVLLGKSIRILDCYHCLSSSNMLRALLADRSSARPFCQSILEAQGEIDMLATTHKGLSKPDLYVFELKQGPINTRAVRQLANYAIPLAHLPIAEGFRKKIIPVLIGSGKTRQLDLSPLQHPRLAKPILLHFNPTPLQTDHWWTQPWASMDMCVL